MTHETMLTPAQFAALVGRSERTIQLWAKKRQIPGQQRTEDGSYLIPASSAEQIRMPKLGRPRRQPTENDA